MNYTKLFYWLTVADNAKFFFGCFAFIFIAIFIIVTLVRVYCTFDGYVDDEGDFYNKCNKWTWYSTPFMLIFLAFKLSSYLLTEIKNMAKDAEVELNIKDNKQKILEKAKSLTAEELIQRLKEDSSIRNIILESK